MLAWAAMSMVSSMAAGQGTDVQIGRVQIRTPDLGDGSEQRVHCERSDMARIGGMDAHGGHGCRTRWGGRGRAEASDVLRWRGAISMTSLA